MITIFTEQEAFEAYDEMFNDNEGSIMVYGTEYTASEIMKKFTPEAYRELALEWFDSLAEENTFVEGLTVNTYKIKVE